MNGIDLDNLRQVAQEAKVRAREVRRLRADVEKREQKAREAADRAKAEMILSQVQSRCMAEAQHGRCHAIIMSVGQTDYERPQGPIKDIQWDHCDPRWLKGAAKLVYEALATAYLNPTIDYWHDGVGVNSGFNIVAHFEE